MHTRLGRKIIRTLGWTLTNIAYTSDERFREDICRKKWHSKVYRLGARLNDFDY